jgi:DNA-directed RNA polymerase I subunit RPA1
LLKLLRAKCFHCHRIRVSREKIRTFEVLFLLIKLGYALEARELRELLETLKRVGAATKGSAIRKTSDTTQRKGSASTTV